MANFFGKPKLPPAGIASASTSACSVQKTDDTLSTTTSKDTWTEFEKAFRPFVLKKDAEIAPSNWFRWSKQYKGKERIIQQAIVIDDAVPNNGTISIPDDDDDDDDADASVSDVDMADTPIDLARSSARGA